MSFMKPKVQPIVLPQVPAAPEPPRPLPQDPVSRPAKRRSQNTFAAMRPPVEGAGGAGTGSFVGGSSRGVTLVGQ